MAKPDQFHDRRHDRLHDPHPDQHSGRHLLANGPGGAEGVATGAVMTPLEVFHCPLEGIHLIEASAGTGKTWNLCALVLRLVLERGLTVDRILVVTFTKAATAELRTRIRQGLTAALVGLRDASARSDPFVNGLLQAARRAGVDDQTAARRLQGALDGFDEAAIATIHGFCQRALGDAPFTGKMPLSAELSTDDDTWVDAAARDFWRRHIAPAPEADALAIELARRGDTPHGMGRLLKRHLAKPLARLRWPAGLDELGAVEPLLHETHAAARALWQAERSTIMQRLHEALPRLNANRYKAETLARSAEQWDAVMQHDNALLALTAPHRVSVSELRLKLLGADTVAAATKKGQARVEHHPFFDAAQRLLLARDSMQRSLALRRLALLQRLLQEGGAAVRRAKREARAITFDDMLLNLHTRLTGGAAQGLVQALRDAFPAALIDEFQDTDPLQFEIFQALYGADRSEAAARDVASVHDSPAAHASGDRRLSLFMIGDPKQAIYSFRHADLPTYLRATATADARHTLADNQRSTPGLIAALNTLFSANPRAFLLDGLVFRKAGTGPKSRPVLEDDSRPAAPLQVWLLPRDAQGAGLMSKAVALHAAARACAAEIARLLQEAGRGGVRLDGRPLRAAEIAVLVRTHREGALMRQALAEAGVASAELSQASVFTSPDALELQRLLQAVLDPSQRGPLRAALSTQWMGLQATQIEALGDDAGLQQAWLQGLLELRQTWLRHGVGVMLRRWIARERVAQRLLTRPDGARRMTNLLHLAELLHKVSSEHPSPESLLRWLAEQRREHRLHGGAAGEEAQLRLDSDHHLVQIITIHKAKGLEFPIVFCPALWTDVVGADRLPGDGLDYHDDHGQAVIDFRQGLDPDFDQDDISRRRRAAAAAESLRLIYVALTRAVHRCTIVAGSHAHGRDATGTGVSSRSLLNWLVVGADEEAVAGSAAEVATGLSLEAWLKERVPPAEVAQAWTALARLAPDHIAVDTLPQAHAIGPAQPSASAWRPAERTPPPLPEGWVAGSYSSLIHRASHEAAAVDHDQRAAGGALQQAPPAGLAPADILRFPRGAREGTCIHAVFEAADFTDPRSWPQAVDGALRAWTGAADPASFAPMLLGMLRDVLHTPLPLGTAQPLVLAHLPAERRTVEMEFLLPTDALHSPALNQALQRWGYAVPPLTFGRQRGYLKGFIDLVFEHEGRYFVLDWKSNHLGWSPADYAPSRLAQAMAAEGYHLQHLLYNVALHRHLARRLRAYDPAVHLGGVAYLFVRGLRPDWRSEGGYPCGLYVHRPRPEVVQELSVLIAGEGQGEGEGDVAETMAMEPRS